MAYFLVQSVNTNHGIGLFGNLLKVAQRAGRYFSEHYFFCSTSAKGSAHFICHLLSGSNLPFFRQVPCSTQRFTSRHNGYFHQWVSIFQYPANKGMPCFVECNYFLFAWRYKPVLLLQSANHTVNRIEEILFVNYLFVVSRSNKRSLVTNIRNISARETGGLLGKKINIYRGIYLQGFQVNLKNIFTLNQVWHVNINLPVKTAGAQ